MIYQTRIRSFLISVLTCSAHACGSGGDFTADPADQHHHESVTIWTDSVELFFEHPELFAGEATEPWVVHLTDLRTHQPVTEGVLTLRFMVPDSGEFVESVAEPARPGVFAPAPSFSVAGEYELVMDLNSPRLSTEVVVGPVVVRESHDDRPRPEDEPPAGITFLKEQQWAIAFATEAAAAKAVPRSIGSTGEIIPQVGGLVEVTAPVAGLVLPEDNGAVPIPGDWVRKGDTLAVLAPVSGDDAYALQIAREQRLALEVARAERLYSIEAIPARRLEDARRDLAVARAALASMGATPGSGFELSLRAPITGVVDRRELVMGQRVTAGQLLYSIVDPRTVWLRMDVAAHHAVDLSLAAGATFKVEGSDEVYRSARVVSVGKVIDRARRTLPIVLEVDNKDQRLRIGMLAEGLLLLGEPETGTAVPTSAVREEDGLNVAYVQIGGETFQRRILTLGPSDGVWTIVRTGVASGERVVTLGAYQVKLASLNTAELSDRAHAH
jgi:RND family efflux transporter MFP subunit